ncbi:hypothetical protein GCM10023186_25550 [Hymenobacter koreensis]|uniref:Uncharacterized protein n=1 Tax=Hymenobacter koreensis TaxID=1084523 RepID=A0ABP8J2P5_9BACT
MEAVAYVNGALPWLGINCPVLLVPVGIGAEFPFWESSINTYEATILFGFFSKKYPQRIHALEAVTLGGPLTKTRPQGLSLKATRLL